MDTATGPSTTKRWTGEMVSRPPPGDTTPTRPSSTTWETGPCVHSVCSEGRYHLSPPGPTQLGDEGTAFSRETKSEGSQLSRIVSRLDSRTWNIRYSTTLNHGLKMGLPQLLLLSDLEIGDVRFLHHT